MPIPDLLLQSYLSTDYRVYAPSPFSVRIGKHSPELTALMHARQVTTAAILTGWNPRSVVQRAELNRMANETLRLRFESAGLQYLRAFGKPAGGQTGGGQLRDGQSSGDQAKCDQSNGGTNWKGEESWLVLGLTREQALGWGQEFEQNALVWSMLGGLPELVLID